MRRDQRAGIRTGPPDQIGCFYLDGPNVKTVTRADKKGRYLININARNLRSGVHRVRIVVVFVPSSKTRTKTLHVVVARCRPPRRLFTG